MKASKGDLMKKLSRFVGIFLISALTISMFAAFAGSVVKAQRDMKDRTFETSEALPARELDKYIVYEMDEELKWELDIDLLREQDQDIQREQDQDYQAETHEDSDGGFQSELSSNPRNKIGSYVTDTPF